MKLITKDSEEVKGISGEDLRDCQAYFIESYKYKNDDIRKDCRLFIKTGNEIGFLRNSQMTYILHLSAYTFYGVRELNWEAVIIDISKAMSLGKEVEE